VDEEGFGIWQKEKPTLGLTFPNLPYWKDSIYGNVTESRAILKHIARNYGNGALLPVPKSMTTAEMLENVLWDTWYLMIRRCIDDTEAAKNNLATRATPKFEHLDKFMNGKLWITGEKISYVDFMMYEVLHHYVRYDEAYLTPYPNLTKFKKNFEDLPKIRDFMRSHKYIKDPVYHPLVVKHKFD